jgi:hypothetical protein
VNDLRKPPGDRESAVLTIWQVNFADDQILELTQAEIEQDLAAGNLSGENWVWRDGMASWLPITDVPEFARALSAATPPSGFRPRPDDEVESIPLEPDEDEKTVALKNPSVLSGYERPPPRLEFSADAEAEPPTSRAPSVVPSRIESVGPDKTPAYGSIAPRPSSSGAAAGVSPSAQPAAILLRGSAAPSAATGAESPPPLPPRKPVIPVSVASSPNASPQPLPAAAPDRPVRAAGSVFPPPSPGAELVAPRPTPQAELPAPKAVPAEPLVATPAPPPVFEDLGLLIPEEMKSDAVWPAPDPSLTRKAAEAAETPLPLRSRPPAAPAARARPVANEPLVIVAGPSETLPATAERSEQAAPARNVSPKLPIKATPPVVMRELPAAKAQLVDIKANELMNESTLITGRRRTKHWVSMTNAVIGAICAASIAAALTALVMQATEQSRLRAAAQLVPASAPLAAAPPASPVPVAEPAATVPKAEQVAAAPAESAAAAQPAEPAVTASPVVAPAPKPEVTPEQPVAVKAASAPAKRRPAQKASTNPYDDYQPTTSESPKRSPAKAPASDDAARNIPAHPGF